MLDASIGGGLEMSFICPYWGMDKDGAPGVKMEIFLLGSHFASPLPYMRNNSLATRSKFPCHGLVIYSPIV